MSENKEKRVFDKPVLSMDENGVHIIDREIAEKLEKKNISASMITGLIGDTACAARWVAETFVIRDLIEEKPDNPARRGNLFHEIMEDLFALPAEERSQVKLKELAIKKITSDDYKDLAPNKEVRDWLSDAVKGYYEMGGNPQKVQVASVSVGGKDEKLGIEIFVKGKIGNAKREVLGFIDRLVLNPAKNDGSVVIEDWKGLALDTLLPTPTGWTTMGEVQEGDKILGTNGMTTTVLNKSGIHNRPCYKITFADGSYVISDNVHLWSIKTSNTTKTANYNASAAKELTVNTDELYELWKTHKRDYLQIENPKPITAFDEKKYDIHPYVLGVWLGDGSSRDGRIHAGHEDADEMRSNLKKFWNGKIDIQTEPRSAAVINLRKPISKNCPMGNSDCRSSYIGYRCQDCRNVIESGNSPKNVGTNACLTILLRINGLKGNKHVPQEYLRGSLEQRLQLLQGLMDTDGTWHPNRKRALFYTTNKSLSNAVAELVISMGVTPTTYRGENEHKGFYEVGFSPVGFNPFKLERKAKQVEEHFKNKEYRSYKALHRYVRTIEPIESVPTQCIRVDSEDSLYLCGPLMTPTHNTGAKPKIWKSHTKSEEGLAEQRQQHIYRMLLEQNDVEVSGARLIYPVARTMVKVDLNDEKLIERVVEDVEKTDEMLDNLIETNNFEYSPSFLCSWCPLQKICARATIKPYEKMQKAAAEQPEPEILLKAIELQ